MPLFGGHRGGKKRDDGLPAGSQEAIEADRKKDAQRKREARKTAREAREPEPLPSAATPGPDAPVAVPGGPGPGAPVETDSFIPWQPQSLKPLFDELIPVVEEECIDSLTGKATEAKLPSSLVKEIGKDAAWSKTAKTSMGVAAPQVAAKWLNKAGISAEHQPEVVLGLAVLAVCRTHLKLSSKLDKLIADRAKDPANGKPL